MLPYSDQELYASLTELNVIDKKKLDEAWQLAQKEKKSLAGELFALDLISDENLGKLIADNLKLPFISLATTSIDKKTLNLLDKEAATRNKAIVFDYKENVLKLATSNPQNTLFIKHLAQKIGGEVKVFFATEMDIKNALSLYRGELQNIFDQMISEQLKLADSGNPEPPITKIVDTLIEYAYSSRASDIHVEPEEKNLVIRFRIDGVLHDVLRASKKLHDPVINRIKVLSKLRTDEHLSAQDGKLQVKLPDEDLDVRVSIVPVVEGEKAVLRLLSSKSRQFGLQDLGMSDSDLEKLKTGFNKPYGMVLSTGPTGSGKTTTMYAILKILNTREKNIATIEDPVEYEIDGINQIQVNTKTNLTFADGLRSILRQDPDTIFVGEIRDKETADIAINSAMTGHLVISTLHTNNASTSLPRLYDMDIEPFLISSTVNVVVGQRLIRKICEKCKFSVALNKTELDKYFNPKEVKKYFTGSKEARVYKGKGCPVCHMTGYTGRIGLFEVLNVSSEIQKLINQKADSSAIEKQAILEGMATMTEDGLSKIQQGITTIEEVLRAVKE